MKNRGRLNRGIATVLSAALLVGMSPAIPDMSLKSYADTATEMAAPSVQAYADKDILMGDTFAPDSDGKNNTVGLLYFGKDSDGIIQKWYILGADEGATGSADNTVIFAATELTKGAFQSNTSSNPKWSDANDGDYTGSGNEMTANTEVNYNHYGVSDIRKTLQTMEGEGSTNFTESERKLLQSTKVKTSDYKNKKDGNASYYTTEDKLYLASGDFTSDETQKYIYVGSSSDEAGKGIKLSASTYWKKNSDGGLSDNRIWLRSPIDYYCYALIADPFGGGILFDYVHYGPYGVRPASNLNLKDVLFASAAPAAESVNATGGIIKTSETEQAAMTLRLDGSDKHIGSFTYDDSVIKVKHGSTKLNVSLVVQGNNGTCDWYFCKQISSDYDEEIYPSAIESAFKAGTGTLTISADDIKFTDPSCKIWLEIPDEYDSTLAYAVDKNTKQQHVHVYPTNKATPTELM